ncbi:MAG TPA: Pvc16 family protein [Blastocatellia bacterium]|nr:Pvc16 family protein [Blastocatellia bacterium]
MSYLAIGSVTNAIAELLDKKLNKPPLLGSNLTIQVTTLPPDDERVERDNGVNLFLFRVAESPFARNRDWPGDRVTPGVKRPPVALTLHYLLTAYAKKSADAVRDDVTAHQILGNALAILHENAVLNDVHDSDFDADLDTQLAPELRNAFEKVKVTFSPISMEEFSKIWTGLSKAYRLSVAYEVSLVQIAPIQPAPMAGPPVQRTNVDVSTLTPPVITAVEPSSGPAGSVIKIKGSGFRQPGRTTIVTVDNTQLAEADLTKVTEHEITFKFPAAIDRGPEQLISVAAGGIEGAPISFKVDPFAGALDPLRGITGIPLRVSVDLSKATAGVTVSGEFDGQSVSAAIDGDRRSATLTVPDVATNGFKRVALIVNDPTPKRTNEITFEVLPDIESVTVTSGGAPVTTTITVAGRRLQGENVRVRYGGLLIAKGENATANEVVVQIPRVLPADQPTSVIVDGRESASWPPRVDRIEPPDSLPGRKVAIFGHGLSGTTVEVRFATKVVSLGATSYSSRLDATVPTGLTPGIVQVRAVVDGVETNSLDFEVDQ